MALGLRRAAVPFAADLARHGDAPALITGDGSLTYRELAGHVEDVRRRLGEEQRLLVVEGANEVEPIVTYLAALAGGHPVLLAPPEARDALAGVYDPARAYELHPELALLLSTSGSTGSPKLVRLSHENVQSNAEAIAEYLQIRPTDRAATTLPMHYCYGLSVINSHLLRGAALVLTDLSVVDGCFWELFRRERATSFAGVPYTFELLERVGFAEMDVPHLRYVTQAGGRLAPERVARWAARGRERGWDLFVMYGQTEATARMAYLPPDLAASRPEAIGVPIPGGSLAIEDGELVYRGPNVMLGYAEAPEDLARGREVEALRTGDLARQGADGLFEIVGRRSRFAKVLGLRIDLDRAEALLGACCAGIEEGVVVAVEDGRDPAALRREAAQSLGIPARAVRALSLDAIPRLPSGKPDYEALAALGAALPAAAPAPERPGGLVRAFAEVLDRPDATPADTFVSLGGDSLSYVEMSVRLEEALGHLPAGWHLTPIGELAATRPRRMLGRALETSVALRAAAIVLIVSSHAGLLSVLGGAHLLVAVAGFNFARFQLGPGPRWERLRGQLTSVARIALPSVAWIAFAALLLTDDYGVANVLLGNAVAGSETWDVAWHFWFVEVLLYLLVAFAALLAIPRVDRAERRWPLGLALAVLAVGLLGRFGLLDLGIPNTRPVLWLFALGWAAARCTSWQQRALVTALALATIPGFFGDLDREAVVAAGVLLLLWAPSVRVPALVAPAVAVLASASLYVYLVHWQVYQPLEATPLLAIAASLAAGILYWRLAGFLGRRVEIARRRSP